MFFQYKMESCLRKILKNKMSAYFSDIENECIYTVDEFVTKLKTIGFFDLVPTEFNENDVLDGIIHLAEEYSDIIDYYRIIRSNSEYFYDKELGHLRYNNYCPISLRRNNFVDFLCDSTIEPIHNYRNVNAISKKKKLELWNIFCYGKDMNCLVCNESKLSREMFDIGYIETIQNGGDASLDNLFPICLKCNNKKGNINWYDYDIDSYNMIIKIKNEISDTIKERNNLSTYMDIE